MSSKVWTCTQGLHVAMVLCLQLVVAASATNTPDFSVRLVNGSAPNEGRVEVYYQGEWGTICDLQGMHDWNSDAADVVCRQLGYRSVNQIDNNFGRGTGRVVLTNLYCSASDSSLAACQHDSLNNATYCPPVSGGIAGVSCNGSLGTPPIQPVPPDFAVRLQNGTSDSEGRVEIAYQGVWGSVCHDGWTKAAADVVCRQLGYPSAIYAWKNGYFGQSPGSARLDDLDCTGAESMLAACGHSRMGSWGYYGGCQEHRRDAGVTCMDETATQPVVIPSVTPVRDFSVRLVDGAAPNEGRVEVYYKGEWGAICDSKYFWGIDCGNVVCKQLGYDSAFETKRDFGRGSARVIMTHVDCDPFYVYPTGYPTLAGCRRDTLDNATDCPNATAKAAGVSCDGMPGTPPTPSTSDFSVRLRDGARESEGRVEILYMGEWGTICHYHWTKSAADVVCRQLGYPSAIYAWKYGYFGEGSGHPSVENIQCTGVEPNLGACGHNRWFVVGAHCSQSRGDAGVTCYDTTVQPTVAPSVTPVQDFSVRLVDGSAPNEGRVEVYFRGEWNTICDVNGKLDWDDDSGNLVCRQLGYQSLHVIKYDLPRGSGPSILQNLLCSEGDTTLAACQHDNIFSTAYCSEEYHYGLVDHHAAVACQGVRGPPPTPPMLQDFSVRLQDGASDSEGRVEISYQGVWGSICHINWTKAAGDVVCRQLGYPSAIYAWKYGYFGQNPKWPKFEIYNCTGQESNLAECGHLKWGSYSHACTWYRRDAGVTCENGTSTPPTVTPAQDFSVRLADGSAPNVGRIEVYYQGEWGSICDQQGVDDWNRDAANVVCRQLGYTSMYQIDVNVDRGSGRVILANVSCSSLDSNLAACKHDNMDSITTCSAVSDSVVGVACDGRLGQPPTPSTPPDFTVRLKDGRSANEGRVEIFYRGEWGTVCDDGWDDDDADVVCRQLHYQSAITAVGNGSFGQGTGIISLTQVDCSGTEPHLAACGHGRWAMNNCNHSNDASVICNGSVHLTTPYLPTTTMERLTTTPELKITTLEPPTTSPEPPTTTPEPSTTTSEPPVTTPKLPTTTPELPATTAPQLPTTQQIPATTLKVPTSTLERTTATPAVPTTKQGPHATTREVPTTSRGLPTAQETSAKTPVITTRFATQVASTEGTTMLPPETQGLSGGAIAGIVLAVLVAACVVAVLAVYFLRQHRDASHTDIGMPLQSEWLKVDNAQVASFGTTGDTTDPHLSFCNQTYGVSNGIVGSSERSAHEAVYATIADPVSSTPVQPVDGAQVPNFEVAGDNYVSVAGGVASEATV